AAGTRQSPACAVSSVVKGEEGDPSGGVSSVGGEDGGDVDFVGVRAPGAEDLDVLADLEHRQVGGGRRLGPDGDGLAGHDVAEHLLAVVVEVEFAVGDVLDVALDVHDVEPDRLGGEDAVGHEDAAGVEAVAGLGRLEGDRAELDRKSTRLNSSHVKISYAVF